MNIPTDPRQIQAALSAPFAAHEVRFRPGATANGKALAPAYVSARVVQQRLDDVMGFDWRDEYEFLPGGCVLCKLSLRVAGEWATRADVGSPSEQPDEGDQGRGVGLAQTRRLQVGRGGRRPPRRPGAPRAGAVPLRGGRGRRVPLQPQPMVRPVHPRRQEALPRHLPDPGGGPRRRPRRTPEAAEDGGEPSGEGRPGALPGRGV